MISDVLSEAVNEIDRYLNDFSNIYGGDLRARIVKVRDDMHSLRAELDAPPPFEILPVNPMGQKLRDFQSMGRAMREPAPLQVLENGWKLPPKGVTIMPFSFSEAIAAHGMTPEEFVDRFAPKEDEETNVPGTITIDEQTVMINKRTGKIGIQFKVSFKPESEE